MFYILIVAIGCRTNSRKISHCACLPFCISSVAEFDLEKMALKLKFGFHLFYS